MRFPMVRPKAGETTSGSRRTSDGPALAGGTPEERCQLGRGVHRCRAGQIAADVDRRLPGIRGEGFVGQQGNDSRVGSA